MQNMQNMQHTRKTHMQKKVEHAGHAGHIGVTRNRHVGAKGWRQTHTPLHRSWVDVMPSPMERGHGGERKSQIFYQ